MFTCPNCNKKFERMIRNACPECKQNLYRRKQKLFLESERTIAENVAYWYERFFSRNYGYIPNTYTTVDGAYRLTEEIRNFLYNNNEKDLHTATFALEVMDEVASDKWWADHLDSLYMLTRHIQTFAGKVLARKLEERAIPISTEFTLYEGGYGPDSL